MHYTYIQAKYHAAERASEWDNYVSNSVHECIYIHIVIDQLRNQNCNCNYAAYT